MENLQLKLHQYACLHGQPLVQETDLLGTGLGQEKVTISMVSVRLLDAINEWILMDGING